MDGSTSGGSVAYEPPRAPRRRVKSACERCRRQKLGCDQGRPCAMCVRSGSECISKTPLHRRKRTEREHNATPAVHSVEAREQAQESRLERCSPVPGFPPVDTSEAVDLSQEGQQSVPDQGFHTNSYTQGSSIMDFSLKVFDQHEHKCDSDTFAIPGGAGSTRRTTRPVELPLHEVVGFELPPRHITDFLLETYFRSVHWFMMVLHEPSFRNGYDRIIGSRAATQQETPFVVLIMMVLTIGARYATKEATRHHCQDFDLQQFQDQLLKQVRHQMFELYDDACLEAVQITILLGSFYLYNARPNLAFSILGAGIKCAQAMGLHVEPTWNTKSDNMRDLQRHTWWALYVFDRFASIVFGKPCTIRDIDCNVSIVQGFSCDPPQPEFTSTEVTEDGTTIPVTLFTYHRYKNKLYRIASPVLENLHLLRGAKRKQIIEKTIPVHQQLLSWYSSLPHELKLKDSLPGGTKTYYPPPQATLKMQAVALQLAYDNIMIVLHRPLLLQDPKAGLLFPTTAEGEGVNNTSPLESAAAQEAQATSKNQSWISAMRTARVIHHSDVLRLTRTTHAASYTGMHMFTSGVLLSIVALSQPVSAQSQEAKKALGGIIRLLKAFGPHTVLSAQSSKILEALLKLIMGKEMEALLSGPTTSLQPSAQSSRCNTPRATTSWPGVDCSSSRGHSSYSEPWEGSQTSAIQGSDVTDRHEDFLDPYGFTDFNPGFQFVQEVIRSAPGNCHRFDETGRVQQSNRTGHPGSEVEESRPESDLLNDPDRIDAIYNDSLGGLNENGQIWLWDAEAMIL